LLSGLSEGTLHFLERWGWWGHFIGVIAFLIYIPYSKHLHIFLAFPNAYFLDDSTHRLHQNLLRLMQMEHLKNLVQKMPTI